MLALQNFMVPYVMSGIGDPAPHIATLCMNIIDSCGRLYEEEHGDDVSARWHAALSSTS